MESKFLEVNFLNLVLPSELPEKLGLFYCSAPLVAHLRIVNQITWHS